MNDTTTTKKMVYGPYGWLLGTEDSLARYRAYIASICGCTTNDSDEEKNTVTLIFKREELLYDIENLGYVEGDVMKTDAPHDKHQVQDIGQDGNVDRVTRMLDLAHALCQESLHKYTKDSCTEDMELTDDLEEAKLYVIRLKVGSRFSKTTANLLEKLIHEFMVCTAMADWLSITKPEAAEKWQAKAQAAIDKAKEVLRNRDGITLRPLRPW